MKKLKIIKLKEGQEKVLTPGLTAHLFPTNNLGPKNVTIGFATYQAKVSSIPNIHKKSEELKYILRGHAKIIVDDEEKEVSPGMVAYIPVGAEHTVINIGDSLLEYIFVLSPPE